MKSKAKGVPIMRSGPIKILLCEDNTELREGMARILKISFNAQVEQCETGLKAKEILGKETFDVVISDYDMGKNNGTGIDVFHHILKVGLQCRFYLFTGTLIDFAAYESYPIFKHISKPGFATLTEDLTKHLCV